VREAFSAHLAVKRLDAWPLEGGPFPTCTHGLATWSGSPGNARIWRASRASRFRRGELVPIKGGLVEIVERAYDVAAPLGLWLQTIRSTAERAFPDQIACQAYTFSVSPTGEWRLGEIASEPEHAEWLRRSHRRASPALIREIYLKGPIRRIDDAVAGRAQDLGAQSYWRERLHVTAVHGLDPSGNGCSLAIIRSKKRALSRVDRVTLERIAAHLGAAYRLRLRSTSPTRDHPDAVLKADGAVAHAEGSARDADVRAALREAALRMDRARSHYTAECSDEALAFWRALVEGRWSLVERFESDGRRVFLAHRNDPGHRASRALTELESKVVALLAIGHSQKMCAYELGRAESTVSELAASAMRKLGVRSRVELVELHGAVIETSSEVEPPAS
jgi:DNA-binding CsgD family transcriptional regulator